MATLVPQVSQCFPMPKRFDAPCAARPYEYAFTEQFSCLMALSHYRMLGGSVQNLTTYIQQKFSEEEKIEMQLLITVATDAAKVVDFLAKKFPRTEKDLIAKDVEQVHNELRSEVSAEQLKVYDTLRLSEVGDPSLTVQPYLDPQEAFS